MKDEVQWGGHHQDNAHYWYLLGVTKIQILEHALMSNPTSREGKRFISVYGVMWSLCVEFSGEFDEW
jgi:hypothetical protein